MEERCCVVRGESTDRSELFEMVITTENGNSEMIQKEK